MARGIRVPSYSIVANQPGFLVIKDEGDPACQKTITNDPESVLEMIQADPNTSQRLNGRRLLYYDSDGVVDEILYDPEWHDFAGFRLHSARNHREITKELTCESE